MGLVHRALRLGLTSAKLVAELEAIVAKIESYLPKASLPIENQPDLSRWEKVYASDPWVGYRAVPESARAAFDRRLMADAVQRLIELRALDDPSSAKLIALADEAITRLPERPKVAEALVERGVANGAKMSRCSGNAK